MSKAWIDKIRKVTPYVPGDQPKVTNIIKLNTNENPYPPSPRVAEALKNIDTNRLRLYPDPEATELTQALADYYGLGSDQVFVGNGSDEVLALAFLTYFNSDKEILFPNISYSFYPVYGDLYGIKYRKVPLNDNFEINKNDYMVTNGGIIFPNPNAPTSIEAPLEVVEDIVKANRDVVVIIDEAYVDFGAQSAVELINKYDNLVVVHTYSKSRALAGLRLGVALGSKEIISHLKAVKNSFNSYPIDYIAQTLATAAIKDVDYFKEITNKVINTRDYVTTELKKLGFVVPDSKANFLFVTHPQLSAKDLFEFLKENKIFVRYFNSPLIDNHLRITIGTDEEMGELLKFIKTYLEKNLK
ncbi:histidinol-phosphate aminotransferase [Clostridium polyendosporum]|uniref:Histidinol-phosphate aminotransferase n=1 Tax=Clostridium polyendosporum TaxID=69208 RepID=A0A919S003_9CLOT|nr:histidinol-phosphate transaminase [Clostridium polyendosporum]GIM29607.1 histidinol-phosphate aminotransferase [Clostridium polyendosporum]